jgi:hypothetical protein
LKPRTEALPPIPFTGSQLFTIDVRDLSELSEEVHHHKARLTPEKRLQEGDNIESLLVQLPPGYFFVTEAAWWFSKCFFLVSPVP